MTKAGFREEEDSVRLFRLLTGFGLLSSPVRFRELTELAHSEPIAATIQDSAMLADPSSMIRTVQSKVLHKPRELRSSNSLLDAYIRSVHLAAVKNDWVVLWYILQDDCEARNMLNRKGESPVHIAAKYGSLHCLKILLDNQSSESVLQHLSKTNIHGCTPLYLAARNGHLHVAKFILALAPLTVTMAARKATLPIHIAAQHHHLEVVAALSEAHPSSISSPRIDGNLPLHMAFRPHRTAVPHTTAPHNADPHTTGPNSSSPDPLSMGLILGLTAGTRGREVVQYRNGANQTPIDMALLYCSNLSHEVLRHMLLLSSSHRICVHKISLLWDANWELRRVAMLVSFSRESSESRNHDYKSKFNANEEENVLPHESLALEASRNILRCLRIHNSDAWRLCIKFL